MMSVGPPEGRFGAPYTAVRVDTEERVQDLSQNVKSSRLLIFARGTFGEVHIACCFSFGNDVMPS